MALHTQTQQQQQQQTDPAGQQRRYNFGGTPSFGLASQLSGMGSGGESYEKLFTKIQNQVKLANETSGGGSKYAVHKLLKSNASLNYSCIIVSRQSGDTVAAHVLVIEKTGSYPSTYAENVNGVRHEMLRTPADALDPKCVQHVQITVGNALKVNPSVVIVADGTLVPNEFDVENDGQVAELVNNTFNSTDVEIAIRVSDYKGQDISGLMQNYKNGKFIVNLHFNSEDTVYYDQTGMPVRQDVCVNLSFKTGDSGQNNRSIHQSEDTIEIVRTYGYIDFEFNGPTLFNGVPGTQKFQPNFIITHIESGNIAPTPDIVMLAVASVMSLKDDMNWMQAFRPSPARKNEIDYNDIGALNIEGNIEGNPTGFGKRYDTKAKTTTVIELNKFIQTLVYPSIMVSIDVPKAGPETWYMAVFQHILMYKDQAAMNRVMSFMVNCTGGAFQPDNSPMFTNSTNQIHGGFYKTKDGYRDLRHLTSYLAVANYVTDTNQQPAIVQQYTNTLYSTNIPAVLRANTRRSYIDEMSGRTAVIKQMFDRMSFSGMFLANWISALMKVGFNPVFSSSGAVNDMFVKRSTADFHGAVVPQDMRLMSSLNVMPGTWGQYGHYNRSY